jgi:thiamine biosynthesis lipoprotein
MEEATRLARKLSALADLGLERLDVSPITTDAVRIDGRTYRVTCKRPAMGTFVSVTALSRSQDRAEEAIGLAFQEMDRLIKLFNRYDGASAVSYLNREGVLESAPPEVFTVVSRALFYHELSRGAFDISVKPLVDLFTDSFGRERPVEPSQEQMVEALELVGSGNIELSRRAIAFRREGMGVTLDGIAKGFIVDRVAESLGGQGLENLLINAGGDIRTAGTKEEKQPWTVAVQDPTKNGEFPDVIHLSDGAVATSGNYEVYFDRQRTFHHIVSSRTGRSPNLNASVSVVAPNSMAADALATTAFVMEPDDGLAFIDALRGCECLIIDKDGRELKSKRWKSADHPRTEKAGA